MLHTGVMQTSSLVLLWLYLHAPVTARTLPDTNLKSLNATAISPDLFTKLETHARLADIAYCVVPPSLGISKPFSCLSHCAEFPNFELVTTWNTGPLLSDSAGYVAVDHGEDDASDGQIVVAFRGTYSITNAVIDLSTVPQEYIPYPGGEELKDPSISETPNRRRSDGFQGQDRCDNCSVHLGFHTAWLHTRDRILPDLYKTFLQYPEYNLTLIGHSLGGAIAMLAALELEVRGFHPTVTTFGEPRVGNQGLVNYLDRHFHLKAENDTNDQLSQRYHRITHVDDPIPLLPLSEWGFAMHAGEFYITKPALSPDVSDVRICSGDYDPECIASQDNTVISDDGLHLPNKRSLLDSVRQEIIDVKTEPWGIPSRYKLWQLFFAHRDYFHRIGLCVPGGDPLGGGESYDFTIDL